MNKIVFKYAGVNYELPGNAITERYENIILPDNTTLKIESWSMGFRPQPKVYLVHHATGNAIQAKKIENLG